MNSAPSSDLTSPFPHFSRQEFLRCMPPCEPHQMDLGFMRQIEKIRERSGVPMKINSAYRSVEYEHSMGRSGNSFHCVGQALDVRCVNSVQRYKLIEACMYFGFLSVMVYPTFLHFDNRPVNKVMVYNQDRDDD